MSYTRSSSSTLQTMSQEGAEKIIEVFLAQLTSAENSNSEDTERCETMPRRVVLQKAFLALEFPVLNPVIE